MPSQLEAWSDMLPVGYRILAANLFLDVFLRDSDGAVFVLETSAGSVSRIASSEEEFLERSVNDDDGWWLRPLVEQCRAAGLRPEKTQCYAFKVLPFMGGSYSVDNIWICNWNEWLGVVASAYAQTRGLSDGDTVEVIVVE